MPCLLQLSTEHYDFLSLGFQLFLESSVARHSQLKLITQFNDLISKLFIGMLMSRNHSLSYNHQHTFR
jgi:hypothetical protein